MVEEKEVPTVTKKRHTYLTYYGLEQQDTYVLKEGIVKTSIILRDGREFNISYITRRRPAPPPPARPPAGRGRRRGAGPPGGRGAPAPGPGL